MEEKGVHHSSGRYLAKQMADLFVVLCLSVVTIGNSESQYLKHITGSLVTFKFLNGRDLYETKRRVRPVKFFGK